MCQNFHQIPLFWGVLQLGGKICSYLSWKMSKRENNLVFLHWEKKKQKKKRQNKANTQSNSKNPKQHPPSASSLSKKQPTGRKPQTTTPKPRTLFLVGSVVGLLPHSLTSPEILLLEVEGRRRRSRRKVMVWPEKLILAVPALPFAASPPQAVWQPGCGRDSAGDRGRGLSAMARVGSGACEEEGYWEMTHLVSART